MLEAGRRSLLPCVREAQQMDLNQNSLERGGCWDGKSYTKTQLHNLTDNPKPEAISTKTKDNITTLGFAAIKFLPM